MRFFRWLLEPGWAFMLTAGGLCAVLGGLTYYAWTTAGPLPYWTELVDPAFAWAVMPGAGLLGAWVARAARARPRRFGRRVLRGAFLGALLSPLNVPLSLAFVAVRGYYNAWDDLFVALYMWALMSAWGLVFALPVALLCGAYVGALAGALAHWWPGRRGERLP